MQPSADLPASNSAAPASDWRSRILTATTDIQALLARSHRIVVLGIKPESDRPAYYVPAYAQRAGFEIVPVPVYYPTVTEILDQKVYRSLADVPGEVDILNVFRRSADIPQHVDEILAMHPKAVWMQLGIRHNAVAERLAKAGIQVVQDRCVLVELRAMGR